MHTSDSDPLALFNERPDLRRRWLGLYLFMAMWVQAAAFWVAAELRVRIAALPMVQARQLADVPLILLASVAGALGVGLLFWLFVVQRFIRPIEHLLDISEAIRWRGHLEAGESAELQRLTQQPAQIGALARSLQAMEQETSRRFTQLNTLLRTSRLVAASLDADIVIDNIFDQMQALFGVQHCAVVTWDQRADLLHMVASRGMGDYADRYNNEQIEREAPSVRAIRNQTPIQISDTETNLAFTPFRERARREGFRSVLAIPLLTRHAAPAALILYKADPYRYSYTDLELASIFGNHAAVALENAALYGLSDERLQEQTRRMEAIVESMRDGLILASPSGRVLYCNQRAAVLLGVDALQVMGRDSAEITTPFFDLADIKDKKQIEVSRENPVQDLRIHFFNVNDARGNLIGRGQLWQDVTHDKELDRMKSALLSTVSHELRTPLATIKGYASTLLAPDVTWDAAAQAEFIQTISDEADRLTALVKDLLDMSRIEAGILDLHCELFDLNDLLKTLLPLFSAETRTRIKLNLANKLPLVSLDQVRINTVMRNLVENALKYSPDSAAIEVRTYQADGQVVFAVRDFGVGVSEAQSKLIFQRFYRADNRLSRQTSGIGLGLSICKGFVEAHGGRIWVDSAEKGATFSFALAYHL